MKRKQVHSMLPVCHPSKSATNQKGWNVCSQTQIWPSTRTAGSANVVTWPRRGWNVTPHLVGDFPGLQHVQPLGHGAVLDGAAVAHVVHNHRAQGLLPLQDLGRRQPVLQAAVLVDVDVVLKGPTVWGRAEADFMGRTLNAASKPDPFKYNRKIYLEHFFFYWICFARKVKVSGYSRIKVKWTG